MYLSGTLNHNLAVGLTINLFAAEFGERIVFEFEIHLGPHRVDPSKAVDLLE